MSAGPAELADVGRMAELLHETAEHHDAFEMATTEHDWWDWYAPYLDARLRGESSEEATSAADRYMAEERGIVRRAVEPSAEARPADPSPVRHELRTILVALDGPPSSVEATDFAVDLAAEHHAELILLHVVPALDLLSAGDEDVVAVPHEPDARDRAVLDVAAAAAADRGVVAETALIPGVGTADAIIAHGEEHDVDLIVVGSCGHNAVRSTILGSVSRGVLRRSPRPVIVVRGDIPFRDVAASTAAEGAEHAS